MPYETRTSALPGDPASGAATFVSVVAKIGGDHELHAEPQVIVTAAIELFRTLRKRLTQLLTIPPGAQGGFLQPPSASHSSEA